MVSIDERKNAPWLTAVAVIAVMMSGLFVGYEPALGDPDCLYRPIKTELAAALSRGTLPFWSDHFGLGMPLAAEAMLDPAAGPSGFAVIRRRQRLEELWAAEIVPDWLK